MKDTQNTMENTADLLKKLYGDELRVPSLKKSLPKPSDISDKSWLIIIVGVMVAIISSFATFNFNRMVTLKEAIYSNTGRVHAEMQRRTNLFSNMVELYLSYTELEKEIFIHVADVRGQVKETQKLLDRVTAERVLPQADKPGAPMDKTLKGFGSIDSSLSQLLAIFEQYPNLKSFEPHKNLVTNIVMSEDRLITERGNLNESIRMYNNMIAKFPYRYIAGVFNFEPVEYFDPPLDIKSPPQLIWKEFERMRKTPEYKSKH